MKNKVLLGVKIIAAVNLSMGLNLLLQAILSCGHFIDIRLITPVIFGAIAAPFIYIGFLTLKQHPYAWPYSIYIASLLIVVSLASKIEEILTMQGFLLTPFAFVGWFFIFYAAWVFWYLNLPKIKKIFMDGVAGADKKMMVKPIGVLITIILGSLIFSMASGIGAYKRSALRGEAQVISRILGGDLPGSLQGIREIVVKNGELKVTLDPYCFGRSPQDHFISSQLMFHKNNDLSKYTNQKYVYNDSVARQSACLYSLVPHSEDHHSEFQENLFLESFDGREARFLVLIAKRNNFWQRQLYGKKEFSITE
jgi:hypothetical protein